MNPELSQLISLQDTDLEIRRLNDEITALPQRRAEIEQQFADSVKEYLALKSDLDAALAERRRRESDLEDEQRKLQKFNEDLKKARNEREYTTALREIDVAKKIVSAQETEILKLMEKGEKLEAQAKERAPEMDARRVAVDKQLAKLDAAVTAHQKRLRGFTAEREKMFATLGANAQAAYRRLSKIRTGTALAEARDYSCQACRMKIRPQVFNDIRRGDDIITCENCGRILFFRQEQAVS